MDVKQSEMKFPGRKYHHTEERCAAKYHHLHGYWEHQNYQFMRTKHALISHTHSLLRLRAALQLILQFVDWNQDQMTINLSCTMLLILLATIQLMLGYVVIQLYYCCLYKFWNERLRFLRLNSNFTLSNVFMLNVVYFEF